MGNDNLMVDINTLIKQLRQQIEQAEWDGQPCDNLKKELKTIQEYHNHTGSFFYPLF